MHSRNRFKPMLTVLIGSALACGALANDAPVKRTVLQRMDVPTGPPHECVLAVAEIAPGASIGRHVHPGIETGYVLEGSITLLIDGEPAHELRATDTYRIAAGKVHDAKNTGTVPARVLGTWVVEQGRPLSTPAE